MSSIFLFIFGTAIGSFLNVLIDRLPREESINGRSHCEYCKKTLSPLDLVPVLSFLFLKGKCRYCGRKLSWQYPGIEILTGLLFVSISNIQSPISNFQLPILNIQLLISNLGIISCLIVIFFIDLKEQIIPDEMQIALFINILLSKIVVGTSVTVLGFAIVEGLIVLLPILLLYLLTKGRGMGFGDVKLAFNMGFFLGLKGGLVAIYAGFILGAISGIILLLMKKKKMKSKIAFGPFLVIGMFIILFFEKPIFSLIQRIYGI